MRSASRSWPISLLLMASLAGAAAPASASTPAAPATPATVATVPVKSTATWTTSGDGRVAAIASDLRGARATIQIVDVTSGAVRTVPVRAPAYSPPDVSISRDGKLVGFTTTKQVRAPRRGVAIYDPTFNVVDTTTGAIRQFPHVDGNLAEGDGTFAFVYRGPSRLRPTNRQENAAVGVLNLTSGAFAKLPGRSSFNQPIFNHASSLHGDRVVYRQANRCFAFATATGRRLALGSCDASTVARVSDDGHVVFVDRRGYVDADAAVLAISQPTLDPALFFAPTARSVVADVPSGDLSKVLIACWPGTGALTLPALSRPARLYVLDRATGLASLLRAPSGPIPLYTRPSFLTAPGFRLTSAGDEVFWTDATRLYRASTAGAPPAALPADCRPS